MKILFTDSQIIDLGDIDWTPIEKHGRFINFKNLERNEVTSGQASNGGPGQAVFGQDPSHIDPMQALNEAEAVFVDGFEMDRQMIQCAPNLRFIGAAATGFNNIAVDFAREKGIAVCNVPAYSTEAVAQHAAALMLSLAGRIGGFDRQVKDGLWNKVNGTAYEMLPITLLDGKSIGIIGYGNIGKRMAQIAQALGMKVNIYSKDPEAAIKSDVVSLHCPLTEDNAGMVDENFINKMKDGAILINTARGGLIDSGSVAEALRSGKLSGCGVDVLSPEPPEADDPLLTAPNCMITPHIAFTPVEIRQRVVDICGENLESFLNGGRLNRID